MGNSHDFTRVCCIEYIWLFVNALCYAVLYISYSKRNFLAFKQFDSMKPLQLLKTHEKMCINVTDF